MLAVGCALSPGDVRALVKKAVFRKFSRDADLHLRGGRDGHPCGIEISDSPPENLCRGKMSAMDEELRLVLEAMRRENAAAHTETRRHFEVVAEGLESKMDAVAESAIAANERIDRLDAKVDRLEGRMHAEFDDVRSMIKFSHHELDRRLRMLEETVADLQSRVERLESSTH